MQVAVLASSHNVKSLDPIDKVTVVGLKDFPGAQDMLREGWITHKFTPFDPVSKRITAEVEKDGKRYTCAKGAPNALVFRLLHAYLVVLTEHCISFLSCCVVSQNPEASQVRARDC